MQFTNLSRQWLQRLLLVVLFFTVHGCVVVKQPDTVTGNNANELGEMMQFSMSDEALRSEEGDFIAYLPPGWFFVDAESRLAAGTLGVAVNPSYTLALVFGTMRSDANLLQYAENEGVKGVAKVSFERRKQRAEAVTLRSEFQTLSIRGRDIGIFSYSTSTLGDIKVGVVRSSLDTYYEVALSPLEFTGRQLPPKDSIDQIFNSLLFTMEF